MKIGPISNCWSSLADYADFAGYEPASPGHTRPEQLSVKVHYCGYCVAKMAFAKFIITITIITSV